MRIGALSALVILCVLDPAQAQVSAIRTDTGFLTNTQPRIDDFSSNAQTLGFTINFFGTRYTQVYVNDNGNITLDAPLFDYTPFGLQGATTPIIAPYFADVDTTNVGSGQTTFGTSTVNGHPAFGVNWLNVGYFDAHADKLNSFQVVLIDRSDTGAGNFDMEFNYSRIQWECGDASGGSGGLTGPGGASAAVGYSNGTPSPTYFQLAGSLVAGSFLDGGPRSLVASSLNSTVRGRYVFAVRNGTPSVIINTNPTGLPVTVDGVTANSPQTVLWQVNSQHTISVGSPINLNGARYFFSTWSDGGAQTHTVTRVGPGRLHRVLPHAIPTEFRHFARWRRLYRDQPDDHDEFLRFRHQCAGERGRQSGLCVHRL